MRYPVIALALLGPLLLSTTSEAAMKKLRSWPDYIQPPSAAIKEQYEYDPAAGALNAKLLRTRSETNGMAFENTYRNGVLNGGHESWKLSVPVYHGFAGILNGSAGVTEVLKYKEQGAWPSTAFNIYEEHTSDQLHSKTILKCQRQGVLEAGSVISGLPGKLYKYACAYSAVSSGVISGTPIDKNLYEYQYVGYYSDYLDYVPAMKNTSSPSATIQSIDFIDATGATRSATYNAATFP